MPKWAISRWTRRAWQKIGGLNYLSGSWSFELFEEHQAPFSRKIVPEPAVAYQMLSAFDRLVDKDFAKNDLGTRNTAVRISGSPKQCDTVTSAMCRNILSSWLATLICGFAWNWMFDTDWQSLLSGFAWVSEWDLWSHWWNEPGNF